MIEVDRPADLQRFVGQKLGVSEWVTVDQAKIDDFARLTGDDNWIHVDVERARRELPDGKTIAHGLLTTIETEAKYAGYIVQQERQIEHLAREESRSIPEEFGYEGIPGLSTEVKQKLSRVRPTTLGQARRIPGVTPAAIAVLDVYLRLGDRIYA